MKEFDVDFDSLDEFDSSLNPLSEPAMSFLKSDNFDLELDEEALTITDTEFLNSLRSELAGEDFDNQFNPGWENSQFDSFASNLNQLFGSNEPVDTGLFEEVEYADGTSGPGESWYW